MRARSIAPWLALALAGCGKETARPSGTGVGTGVGTEVTSVPTPVPTAARATMGPNGCLHDGQWRLCSLVDRLERSGLVIPKPEKDTVRYDFLTAPGVRYKVHHGEIQAFVYHDSARLTREVAKIDTVHVSPAGTLRHWDVHPTFIRSGNLAVVLLTLNDHLVERVQLAVDAGPPQPDPDVPPVPQQLPPTRVP